MAKYFYAARLSNDPIYKLIASELVMHGHINFWRQQRTYGAGPHVCVIDTGIDMTSPFFKGSSVIDTKLSRSFVPGERWDRDGHGHGTFVASQIYHKFSLADVVRGKEIICCGCPGLSRLTILKNLPNSGSGPVENTEKALDYLLSLDDKDLPHIVNCSFSSHPDAIHTDIGRRIAGKVLQLEQRGVLVYCAAGNSGHKKDPRVRFFANITPTSAILASNSRASSIAYFSSRGQHATYAMDGVLRLGARLGDKIEYARNNGTSMACPDAVGFMALCLSWISRGDPSLVRNIIKEGKHIQFLEKNGLVHDVAPSGFDPNSGWGTLWLRDNIELKRV